MMAMVSRDPFARTELHKHKTVCSDSRTCDFCDTRGRPVGKGYQHKLFRFHVQYDGGRTATISGLFCSTSCMKSYHG